MNSNQKKQFIGIIGIFFFLLIGTLQVHGQSYDQSLLMNKEWKYQMPEKTTFYFNIIFTDKEEIIKLAVNDKKTGDEMKSSYYLSDEVVDKFQSNLVGKTQSGKYIVVRSKGEISGERLNVYEILELTDTTLKTKSIQSGTIVEYTAQ